MNSLRLSLVVYFLVLLAAALGAIGALAYGTTQQTLIDKEESTRKLLLERHDGRARALCDERDERILRRAQQLASLVQSQFGNSRYHELYALGVLSAGLQPSGHVAVPLWLAENDARVFQRLRWLSTSRIQFADDVFLTRDDDGQAREYFQIYSETGKPLQHSASLAEGDLWIDSDLRARLSLFEWSYDDTEVSERRLRRVTLKAPVARYRLSVPYPVAPSGDGKTKSRTAVPYVKPPAAPTVKPPFPERFMPSIFIQCAFDTELRDATLARLDAELQTDLANLETESRATLADMRRRLLATGLITFVATLIGGVWLVRLGLLPLHRLSDAVSRVSTKDFHLDVDRSRLPTELQPIVERLQQTLGSLESAFAREKQAAADISHELRTPLAALLATIEVAMRRSRTAEEYRDLLEDCRLSGQHMNRLVERVLALARIDAGADPLRLEAVDATELTAECAALVQPLAEARGVRLNVHGDRDLVLRADARKLREVVNNLLHNALEYNKPNGTVDVNLERQNGTIRIEVRDTGIGMAPEDRAHIFERFYRADPSRQADGVHAGLGLAISKSYVELMGGSIAVESIPGVGSCFEIRLPASPYPKDASVGRN